MGMPRDRQKREIQSEKIKKKKWQKNVRQGVLFVLNKTTMRGDTVGKK